MVNYWKLLMGVFFCLLHFSITLQLVSRNYLDMKIIYSYLFFAFSFLSRVCVFMFAHGKAE